jgi:predicted nucleic acid-binding protein
LGGQLARVPEPQALIVVDSGVWIDYFNGVETAASERLDTLLGVAPLAVGDLILTEVLQGFRNDTHYKTAKQLMTSLTILDMLGQKMAVKSADNYRALRARGVTVRKTVVVIIATYCIEHEIPLLFDDKDFQPFVQHLGLRVASTGT